MRRRLGLARRMRPRRARRAVYRRHAGGSGKADGEVETRLAAADELEIDGGEQLAIELGAVLGALREVDGEAPAQRIEARRRAGIAAAREQQRVLDVAGERRPVQALELGVQELHIEFGIV